MPSNKVSNQESPFDPTSARSVVIGTYPDTTIGKTIKSFSTRTQTVIDRYLYIVIRRDQRHSLREIGEDMGITAERVRQIELKARKLLDLSA